MIKNSIEGLVSEYKCASVLKEMQNNKSPGSDWIATEFYKIFLERYKTLLW